MATGSEPFEELAAWAAEIDTRLRTVEGQLSEVRSRPDAPDSGAAARADAAFARADDAFRNASVTGALAQAALDEMRAMHPRLIAVENKFPAAVEALKVKLEEIAWAKANDAIAARWDQWVRYLDTRFLNAVYNRIMITLERRGMISSGWKRAAPTVYNGDEPVINE